MTRELPIIFSTPLIPALFDGRKTQTRRVLKPQPAEVDEAGRWYQMPGGGLSLNCHSLRYAPGDLLWVKETWTLGTPTVEQDDGVVVYRADDPSPRFAHGPWRSPRFMPKWAARLWLRVTDVRVERVQDITEADAWAEGYPARGTSRHPREAHVWFVGLWDDLHGPNGAPHSWTSNPWVAVYAFKRVRP